MHGHIGPSKGEGSLQEQRSCRVLGWARTSVIAFHTELYKPLFVYRLFSLGLGCLPAGPLRDRVARQEALCLRGRLGP